MASWRSLSLVVALGLLGAGCTDDQANNTRQSHYAARRPVTGSNLPQSAAYGDGVDDSMATRSSMNTMNQASQSSMGGGLSGGSAGGAR